MAEETGFGDDRNDLGVEKYESIQDAIGGDAAQRVAVGVGRGIGGDGLISKKVKKMDESKKLMNAIKDLEKELKGKGLYSDTRVHSGRTRKADRLQAEKQMSKKGGNLPSLDKALKGTHPAKLKNRLTVLMGSVEAGNNGKKVKKEIESVAKELMSKGLISKKKMNMIMSKL